MANQQSYLNGKDGGGQITSLYQIQAAGLKLPPGFVDIRKPSKLNTLFNYNRNDKVLYSKNRLNPSGLKNFLRTRYDYKTPNEGQNDIPKTKIGYSINDAALVKNFLTSNSGFKFIGKQIILQGYQPFDETKVYNPASPLVASIRLASLGALDRPVRHLDTSNIIGGIVNGLGLGGIVSTIGKFAGADPPQPPPPRSSVASNAGREGGLRNIFSSLVGGGDRASEVVAPIARADVKGLLRGQTATSAYNSVRYTRLLSNSSNKGGFFKNLLSGVGKFLQNNTIIGGFIPPKQPWPAKYRADEKTYELYLNSGNLFDPAFKLQKSGGILGGILNSIGLGGLFGQKSSKVSYSSAVSQRFFARQKNKTNPIRSINVARKTNAKANILNSTVNVTGERSPYSETVKEKEVKPISNGETNILRYDQLIGTTLDSGQIETSDQLLNYKYLTDSKNIKNFSDTFSDKEDVYTKQLIENFENVSRNISRVDASKYDIKDRSALIPQQFKGINSSDKAIGLEYLNGTSKPNAFNDKFNKYTDRINNDERTTGNKVPKRVGNGVNDRFISPTNDVDYVNSLSVLNQDEFDKKYNKTDKFGVYGPDIIKFYFYDILNKRYIPFSATVKSITDNNSADWDPVEYLGRPDKLYYYKGFTRTVNFNFTVYAHSIKELMPMWKRINYLVGLTRPANYTNPAGSGFMIAPMVQLTLGDFYKNHNVVISSCNITIPEDAGWELIPEEANQGWFYGIEKSIQWNSDKRLSSIGEEKSNSEGRYAQFPKQADISIDMKILEKDKPQTGKALWGDAPVPSKEVSKQENGKKTISYVNNYDANTPNNFSKNIRTDIVGKDTTNPKNDKKPQPKKKVKIKSSVGIYENNRVAISDQAAQEQIQNASTLA